uniref:Major capsid protein n=1 Tax=Meloidogyne hapla TaxID=6305 RepID=A0A1I8C0X1_MELHA
MTYGEELNIQEAPMAGTTGVQFLNWRWGFTTYEVGEVTRNKMILTLKDIGRISFSRDLPVEDLRRTFIKHDDTYMEQILEMRTATHPRLGYLEHTRVVYTRIV